MLFPPDNWAISVVEVDPHRTVKRSEAAVTLVRHPPAGGCAITVSLTPYRGAAKPAALRVAEATPGIPGAGTTEPLACGAAVQPEPASVAGAALEAGPAAAQLLGTDNPPIEAALPTLPVAPPRPPARPGAAAAGEMLAGNAEAALAAASPPAFADFSIVSTALEKRPSISLNAVAKSLTLEICLANALNGVAAFRVDDPLIPASMSPSTPPTITPEPDGSKVRPSPASHGGDVVEPARPASTPGTTDVNRDSSCAVVPAQVPTAREAAALWAANAAGLADRAGGTNGVNLEAAVAAPA